jgi:hypothetical protein
MPNLALRGLGAGLDLREKLGLDPYALASDPLGVGLRLADQRGQALAQIGGECLVEAMIDFARID